MNTFGKLTMALALAFPAYSSMALETRAIHRPDGTHIFDIRFFDVGDGYFMDDLGPKESPWNLSDLQKDKIAEAIRYWGEIITPAQGQLPAIVNVGSSDTPGNAAGGSDNQRVGDINQTLIQAALLNNPVDELTYGSHAQFHMGKMDWDAEEVLASQLPLPRGSKVDTMAVAFHELAHGLGIGSSVEDPADDNKPRFGSVLNSYDIHVRNSKGQAPRPGQAIACPPCATPPTEDTFDMSDLKSYFVGAHVDEVLDGAMPGVPLELTSSMEEVNENISHLELKNSLMSHQTYRNYTNFMEAELAVLQDMGYTIDRRNFFGRSVYADNRSILNDNGFFKRDAAGTTYLPGQYNTSTLGLGLHVYGKNNTIVQQADLLSEGAGGAGIRVDGSDNTIVVAPGVKIHGNGLNGRGIMFAYGKNHVLVQQGDVQATGDLGIAASFDFGNNAMANADDYRGSYIHVGKRATEDLSQELNGALVDRFDLTGALNGKQAAIYMADNALVSEINVMRGASIQGNIYSEYAQTDDQGQLRMSEISFGRMADADGQSTDAADKDFRFSYGGNIQGKNIALSVVGGATSLNGENVIHSVDIARDATLSGTGQYLLLDGGQFRNDGTLLPGSASTPMGGIKIDGAFAQGDTGRLLFQVDGQGNHSTVTVTGRAEQDGQLSLAPVAGWYANDWRLTSDALLQADSRSGSFRTVDAQLNSPTLSFQATALQNGNHALTISRNANAYSRHAADENGRQLGNALQDIAAVARPDIQPLFTALDFSASDGSTVRSALSQLSPSSYSSMFASSLQRERQISDIVNADRHPLIGGESASWHGFVVPFGGKSWQDASSNRIGYDATSYGVVAGMERRDPQRQAWTPGVHIAISEQTVKPKDAAGSKGRNTSLELGAHLHYAPDRAAGIYAYGQGRVGIEQGKFDRTVQIDTYSAKHKSDWNGFSGTLQAGVGYRFALSPTVSAGPLAALDYSYLKRPGVTESGDAASRLRLESSHAHALRSSIGFGTDINMPLQNENQLKANIQVTWDHEILDRDVTQRASFASYSGIDFESRNRLAARDALGLRGGLSYQTKGGMEVGANISSQWFGSGNKALTGNLTASWKF